MKRVCSGCGVITDKRRCAACARAYELQRGSRRVKGSYDTQWIKLRARALREHPWCTSCGTPGSPANPLTGDHITPRRQGGRNEWSNVQVLCAGCNSSKGARPHVLTHT